jgi:hypothetical protein
MPRLDLQISDCRSNTYFCSQAHGIDHLVIPTRDYLFAPPLEDICRAIDFIHRKFKPFLNNCELN